MNFPATVTLPNGTQNFTDIGTFANMFSGIAVAKYDVSNAASLLPSNQPATLIIYNGGMTLQAGQTIISSPTPTETTNASWYSLGNDFTVQLATMSGRVDSVVDTQTANNAQVAINNQLMMDVIANSQLLQDSMNEISGVLQDYLATGYKVAVSYGGSVSQRTFNVTTWTNGVTSETIFNANTTPFQSSAIETVTTNVTYSGMNSVTGQFNATLALPIQYKPTADGDGALVRIDDSHWRIINYNDPAGTRTIDIIMS